MSNESILRSWKDPEYREALGTTDLSAMPHPAGMIELSDNDLSNVGGAATAITTTLPTFWCTVTWGCCIVEAVISWLFC